MRPRPPQYWPPTSTVFWMPKAGHRADEYEDAFAISEGEEGPVHVAIADGATESAFARAWAQRLVRGCIEASAVSAEAVKACLPAWRTAWNDVVAGRTEALPWYAAAKAEQGAYAALLSLAVRADGTWQAVALGDCGLMHLRDGALVTAWPMDDPEQFNNRPALLSSTAEASMPPMQEQSGRWQPGDAFVLATDALAAWLLSTDPARALHWTEDTFHDAATSARDAGALRNDDVTALILSLPAA